MNDKTKSLAERPRLPLGSKYTEEQRLECATIFSITGNLSEVSRQTDIPHSTIREWTKEGWWESHIVRFREENAAELDARLTNGVMTALDRVQDGLELGDYVGMGEDGTPRYARIKTKDAATTAGILFDKRQLLRNQPTSIKQETGLDDLRSKFEALVNEREAKVISTQ